MANRENEAKDICWAAMMRCLSRVSAGKSDISSTKTKTNGHT